MFNGMRGFGAPGGREQRFSNTETEVRIPLKQAVFAVVALCVVSFVVQRGVIIPVTAALFTGSAWLQSLQTALFLVMWRLSIVVPLLMYAYANILNVLDPNWTAPRSAAPAEIGPFVPAFLRWPLRWMGKVGATATAQNYEAPTASVADRVIKGESIHIVSNNGRTRNVWNFELPLDDLDRLRLHFYKCQRKGEPCGVSVRDLERAGFSKGREGRARAVAEALRTVTEKQGARVVCIPAVVEWILARRYAAHDVQQ